MEDKKDSLFRMTFFVVTVVLGTEISRIFHRQELTGLIEEESYLAEFADKSAGSFDFYHISTNYLSLVVFCTVIFGVVQLSKLKWNREFILIWGAAVLSSVITLIFYAKYFEFSKGYYFTQQAGLLISYYFATAFVIKDVRIEVSLIYLILALFFNALFAHGMQPVIMQITHGWIYFPYGKIEFAVFCIYVLATSGSRTSLLIVQIL